MASYVFDRELGECVPAEQFYAEKGRKALAKVSSLPMPYIRGDLKPYTSPVTGKTIEGRAARREDLARAGCREVDPSEFKPTYKNYEFCQRRRLPYMGGDVPPPMSRDEKAEAKWRKDQVKKAQAPKDQPAMLRGNTKTSPLFRNNTVRAGR